MLYPAKKTLTQNSIPKYFRTTKNQYHLGQVFLWVPNMYGFFAQMIILLRGKRRVRNWKGVVAFFPTTLLNTRVVVIASNDTIEIQHKAKDEVMDDDESDGGGMLLTVALFTRQIIQ